MLVAEQPQRHREPSAVDHSAPWRRWDASATAAGRETTRTKHHRSGAARPTAPSTPTPQKWTALWDSAVASSHHHVQRQTPAQPDAVVPEDPVAATTPEALYAPPMPYWRPVTGCWTHISNAQLVLECLWALQHGASTLDSVSELASPSYPRPALVAAVTAPIRRFSDAVQRLAAFAVCHGDTSPLAAHVSCLLASLRAYVASLERPACPLESVLAVNRFLAPWERRILSVDRFVARHGALPARELADAAAEHAQRAKAIAPAERRDAVALVRRVHGPILQAALAAAVSGRELPEPPKSWSSEFCKELAKVARLVRMAGPEETGISAIPAVPDSQWESPLALSAAALTALSETRQCAEIAARAALERAALFVGGKVASAALLLPGNNCQIVPGAVSEADWAALQSLLQIRVQGWDSVCRLVAHAPRTSLGAVAVARHFMYVHGRRQLQALQDDICVARRRLSAVSPPTLASIEAFVGESLAAAARLDPADEHLQLAESLSQPGAGLNEARHALGFL